MGPSEDIFKHQSIDLEKGPHEVPVENFLNAQYFSEIGLGYVGSITKSFTLL